MFNQKEYDKQYYINNRDKEFNISSAIAFHRGWKKIKEEIEKCEILCCRCHRELHAKGRKSKQ